MSSALLNAAYFVHIIFFDLNSNKKYLNSKNDYERGSIYSGDYYM